MAASVFAAQPKLQDVCGPNGRSVTGSELVKKSCEAAFVSANGWVVSDNNSRVQASAAVVCAYSCLAPMSSDCPNPCSSAYGSAQKSDAFSDSSDAFYDAAQKNGTSALSFQMGGGRVYSEGPPLPKRGSDSGSGPGETLPESCRLAGRTGSVADRINCAAATDPSLPSFVKSPKFLSDFQKITGQPLQAVINKSGETILQDYSQGALQHAYSGMKETTSMSFAEFTNKSMALFKSITGSFTSKGGRTEVAGNSPSESSEGNSVNEAAHLAESPSLNGASLNGPSLNSMPAAESPERKPSRRTLSPENDPEVSLFERISDRHHDFEKWLVERRF